MSEEDSFQLQMDSNLFLIMLRELCTESVMNFKRDSAYMQQIHMEIMKKLNWVQMFIFLNKLFN